MANRVAYESMQIHGGDTYARADVRLMTVPGGTSEIMRETIAKRLLS